MSQKMRKPRPQPPKYYWTDSDACYCCKNKNGCNRCKRIKKYVANQRNKAKYLKSFNA